MRSLIANRLFPYINSTSIISTSNKINSNKCINFLGIHCYTTKPVLNKNDVELRVTETITTTTTKDISSPATTTITAASSSSPATATTTTTTLNKRSVEEEFNTTINLQNAPIFTAKSKPKIEPITSSGIDPLTDKFGRHHTYLRISLTERCNLRCKYCMPAEGVKLQPKSHLLTTDEIIYLARIFVEQGVRKIRLTGGEPTVRRDIVDIIAKIKEIPKLDTIGITTNALVLTRNLVAMQRAGLDAVNISLDTLKPERFEEITRRRGWERVIAGIDLSIQLGYQPKINCVLMRNFNEDEICDFVEFTKDRNVDVRFIEYMPFTGNKWQTDRLISFRETLAIIQKKYSDLEALPNGPNDTSKAYGVPGYKGKIGFITSMTEHFCGSCNRLRLTADGNIKVCLFGNKEFSLRDAIRNNCSESDLVTLIGTAVQRKRKQHAGGINTQSIANRILQKSQTQRKSRESQRFSYENQVTALLLSHSNRLNYISLRRYCQENLTMNSTELTHVDSTGRAKMVDVSEKPITTRTATAIACVEVGSHIAKLIHSNNISKGDVLSISQIAGILGAKKTSELIPLCHNIPLNLVTVEAKLNLDRNCVDLYATVRCSGKTGVEMEALTAVGIAALTIYDMCKAVSHNIVISNIRLQSKSGGKRDFRST